MNKDYRVNRRYGYVFLGIFLAYVFFCASLSAQGSVRASTAIHIHSSLQEFQYVNGNDPSATGADTSDVFQEGLPVAGSELVFSQSSPDNTTVVMFQQADSVEHPDVGSRDPKTRFRREILYGGNKLVLISDRQEKAGKTLYRATGNVAITYLDMIITCDEAEYDEETLRVSTSGSTWFRREKVSLTSSRVEFNPDTRTIILYDASGYFYDTLGRSDREFFLTGGMVQNFKAEKLQIYWGTKKKD